MLSRQEEMLERRRTLENERRIREQTGTYLSHTHSDLGGRYAQIQPENVVGQSAVPQYPAASSSWQIQLPDEPPLGYRIDDLNPSDPVEPSSFTQQATGEPADATVERVGSPLSQSSGDPTPGSHLPTGPARMTRDVGSSPVPYRRY